MGVTWVNLVQGVKLGALRNECILKSYQVTNQIKISLLRDLQLSQSAVGCSPISVVGFINESFEAAWTILCQTYTTMYEFNKALFEKRFNISNYDKNQLETLCVDNRRPDPFTKTSINECLTAIQVERENLIVNPRRIGNRDVDLDFKIDGPGQYRFLDVKNPVGTSILIEQNQIF